MHDCGRIYRLARVLLVCALALSGCSDSAPVSSEFLTEVRDDWVVSEAEATQWHEVKDEQGPALTGNASWQQFVGFV